MNSRMLKKDEETGEIIETFTIYDEETGEKYLFEPQLRHQRVPFKIPVSKYNKEPIKKLFKEKVKTNYPPTVFTAGIYLLPTTIFFNPILAILLLCLEAFIHVWAHRKNKKMKALNVYYQSPLHIICKEFCGACKEEESSMKITKFQEKRADKFKKYGLEYVRGIVT